MNGLWGPPAVGSAVADAFVRRHQPEEAAKVFDLWAEWDGNLLPSGLRAARFRGKIDYLRARKIDVTPYLPGYLAALRDCAKNGCTAEERGEAKLRIVREEMDKMSVDARLKGLFELIDDRFMVHGLRSQATLTIPDACTVGGKTDWARVASATLKALAAGDWSSLWRNTYLRQNRNDLRLNALLEIVGKAEKAGERQIAADLIVKGAAAIGYTKDATARSVDLGGPGVEWPDPNCFDARLKKLDAAMTKLGVVRQ